jgi:hypothetical protein
VTGDLRDRAERWGDVSAPEPQSMVRCGALLGGALHPDHRQVEVRGRRFTVCPKCTPRRYARYQAKHREGGQPS